MTDLIDLLRSFNRKERFHLVGMALGNPDFSLSDGFREQVNGILDLTIPEDALVAMDYHLDWIYASLYLFTRAGGPALEGVHPNVRQVVSGNQEDVDLLIAYKDGESYHLVMLEAKCDTGFTNKQVQSKADRLKAMFGEAGMVCPNVIPHFALVSPRKPVGLRVDNLPIWMRRNGSVPWMQLDIPEGWLRVTRCTRDGRPSQTGEYWKTIHC